MPEAFGYGTQSKLSTALFREILPALDPAAVFGPGPHRQFGGPVEAGRLFETHGLNNREFFIPRVDGQIATAGQLAGGGTNFFIDATGADRAAFEQLKADLTRMLMAMAGPGRVEERAVSAVVQTRRRDPRLFQGAL